MKRQATLVIVLAMAVAATAAPKLPESKEKDDLSKFLGEWSITEWNYAGNAIPVNLLANAAFTFAKDKYTFQIGFAAEEGTIKLDPKAKMPTIDLIIKTGNDAGKEQPGIYKLEGDTITICFALPGIAERPTEFTSTAGNRQILATLKRKK
jgi:uncharacterized protein (TIGR03067 family)